MTSVRAGVIAGHGVFVWDAAERAFVEAPFTVVDPG